jgi:serine/arginine repetitive matrix protein 1
LTRTLNLASNVKRAFTIDFACSPLITPPPSYSYSGPDKSCPGTPTAAMSAALTTNVDQRLLRTTKFPPEFNLKVDMKKVNIQLIKAWVTDEIARILKSEDDVVTELVSNILDESRYVRLFLQALGVVGWC